MIPTVLILYFLVDSSIASAFPEITSYARVSRNGQESTATNTAGTTLFTSSSRKNANEGRGMKNIAITVSPVYRDFGTPRLPRLKLGEAAEYPSTQRYSTLDQEMLAKLDAAAVAKKQIQQRFHPPASFELAATHSNGKKKQNGAPSEPTASSFSSSSFPDDIPPLDSSTFPKPIYSSSYTFDRPDYLSDKPISKPISIVDYPVSDSDIEAPKGSKKKPYGASVDDTDSDSDLAALVKGSAYIGDSSSDPIEFSAHLDEPPSFEDSPYEHDYHREVIYDHVPDFHHHRTTTEKPETNDQRLDKRPHSYYFIGKKLWYVPLYFSIYFIIYIAALVLKSIARHKINFPVHLAEVATTAAGQHARRSHQDTGWWDYAVNVLEAVENFPRELTKSS